MPDILIASDSTALLDEVEAALGGPDVTFRRLRRGQAVLPAAQAQLPDLVVLDLQIGNMGAMAVAIELRQEMEAGRLGATRILMLLDRVADVFLARRSSVEGWLVKPLDAFRLKVAARRVLEGGHVYEGAPDLIEAAAPEPEGVGAADEDDELEPEPA